MTKCPCFMLYISLPALCPILMNTTQLDFIVTDTNFNGGSNIYITFPNVSVTY